jgi:TolB-like protein
MASIIPGYEYDIFISYRQKDNKGDKWVSEFVESLKTELESTFKEEVSVYFDINPHDGLLETHEVDASLKEKLKCLIFIPIISQTYCDPKSYAWQYEFCAFNMMAREGPLGRNIKITGGNVASRILPVRIHDLDPDDKILLENELGGTLRGIEFIYKSAGVNRPLRANEDHPQENFNKTYYRDQINKVANAVKEIISSIKNKEYITDGTISEGSLISKTVRLPFRKKLAGRNVLRASLVYVLTALVLWKVAVICSGLLNMPENIIKLVTLILIVLFPVAMLLAWLYERSPKGFIRTVSAASLENPFRDEQKKPFTSITFMALLLVTAVVLFFLFPQTSGTGPNKGIPEVEKSIAVLPFENDSPDPANAYFINGIMDEILTNLQKIKDFTVISRASTERFTGTNKPGIREIAKKLKVNYIVEGSGQKYGNTLHLNVKLIDAKNEKYLWAQPFDQEIRETKDIFNIQSQIAQTIASRLQATITPEEKRLIETIPTINLTAYDFYQRGEEEMAKHPWPDLNAEACKRAEIFYRKALEYDSTFARAYDGLAAILWNKSDITRKNNNLEPRIVKRYIDSMLILADIALSYDSHLVGPYIMRASYYQYYRNFKKTIEEYDRVIKYNPNDSWAYHRKGWTYEDYDILKSIQNYQKAASLEHGSELAGLLNRLGIEYSIAGFPEKGKYFYLEALKLNGDSTGYMDRFIVHSAGIQGDYKKIIEYFGRRYLTDSGNMEVIRALCYGYTFSGRYQEALKLMEKYISRFKASGDDEFPFGMHFGFVFYQNGYRKEAEYYWQKEIDAYNGAINSGFPESNSVWYYSLATIYAFRGDKARAYENLKKFSQNPTYQLIFVSLLRNDPMFSSIRNEPEFQKIMKDVEAKYQVLHEGVGKWLEEQGK